MRSALLCVLLVACGDDGGTSIDAGGDATGTVDAAIDGPRLDAPPAAFTLTSTAYAAGATIPAVHTCDGANTSPPLAWTNPPAGTMSYAIVFTDTNNGLIHSVIYDIPSTLSALPADVDNAYAPADVPGAHQTAAYNAGTRGYLGPCPPPADNAHTYVFTLYALGVATLPGAGTNTTRMQAQTLIQANDLAMATYSGTYDRN